MQKERQSEKQKLSRANGGKEGLHSGMQVDAQSPPHPTIPREARSERGEQGCQPLYFTTKTLKQRPTAWCTASDSHV